MVGSYDFGGYPTPPLGATGLVRQGLADESKGRAVCSDFLNGAVGSCKPLPGLGIWGGPGWGPSPEAHLGSRELVTRPDVHVINRIRRLQPVVVTATPTCQPAPAAARRRGSVA
jgi:hypothetical protein